MEIDAIAIDIEARFWNRVNKTSDRECWQWIGNTQHQGYGRMQINRKTVLAHRLAYMLSVGSIPDGNVIDHLCKNKQCVNPKHLEAVTPKTNTIRYQNSRKHISIQD